MSFCTKEILYMSVVRREKFLGKISIRIPTVNKQPILTKPKCKYKAVMNLFTRVTSLTALGRDSFSSASHLSFIENMT